MAAWPTSVDKILDQAIGYIQYAAAGKDDAIGPDLRSLNSQAPQNDKAGRASVDRDCVAAAARKHPGEHATGDNGYRFGNGDRSVPCGVLEIDLAARRCLVMRILKSSARVSDGATSTLIDTGARNPGAGIERLRRAGGNGHDAERDDGE